MTVHQAVPGPSLVRTPNRSDLVSPTPEESFAPVADAPADPGRPPGSDPDRQRVWKGLGGRHDNGLHRGWYIGKHYGWYKQQHPRAGGRSDKVPLQVPSKGKAKIR